MFAALMGQLITVSIGAWLTRSDLVGAARGRVRLEEVAGRGAAADSGHRERCCDVQH